jgi:hypothetical protein
MLRGWSVCVINKRDSQLASLRMLNGLRRGLSALPRGVNKGYKNNINAIVTRSLVDLSKKEQGEEAIYIRKMEASRKEALEEKMSEILQRHHEDAEHQALLNLLG